MEFNILLNFIDILFLQMDMFGIREGPLGSADPMVKGMIPSFVGMVGFGSLLSSFDSGVRGKMVDQVKWRRITKEVRSWQKEGMAAF